MIKKASIIAAKNSRGMTTRKKVFTAYINSFFNSDSFKK